MAKVRLERIEEAANNLIMNSRISLLQESEGIDERTRAKSELLIHENVRYIKGQLLQGGILEEAQNVLADVWVQAIMEDIDLSSIGELGNKIAGGAQGAGHAVAGLSGVLSGAAQGGNLAKLDYQYVPNGMAADISRGYEQGYNPDLNVGDTYKVGEFVGEHPTGTGLALGAGLVGTAAGVGAATYGAGKLLGRVRRAGQTK